MAKRRREKMLRTYKWKMKDNDEEEEKKQKKKNHWTIYREMKKIFNATR